MTDTPAHSDLPALCVDLDGTLVATDTAYESLLRVASEQPWLLPAAGAWLIHGRAPLKAWLARQAHVDPASR